MDVQTFALSGYVVNMDSFLPRPLPPDMVFTSPTSVNMDVNSVLIYFLIDQSSKDKEGHIVI